MKCYLCNEDIETAEDLQIVGIEYAHKQCQDKAWAEAQMENGK